VRHGKVRKLADVSSKLCVHKRHEGGIWFFRWTVPASYHELFEGKQEIKHSLRTDNRALQSV